MKWYSRKYCSRNGKTQKYEPYKLKEFVRHVRLWHCSNQCVMLSFSDPFFIDCQKYEGNDPFLYSNLPDNENTCEKCGKAYKRACSLIRHKKYECGQPPRFPCSYCPYMAKYKTHLITHVAHRHKDKLTKEGVDILFNSEAFKWSIFAFDNH